MCDADPQLNGLNVISLAFMPFLNMPSLAFMSFLNMPSNFCGGRVHGIQYQVFKLRCVGFLSSRRGHLNSLVLAERSSRIAAKPGCGHKVQRFTPALGLTRGKNRTFLMKADTEEDCWIFGREEL